MAGFGQLFGGFLVPLFLMMPMLLLSSSSSSQVAARTFEIGGKDGWVVKPSESYNHWAERNRFLVNDTFHFRYQKGVDSVLVVKKEDFDSCNTNNPIQKFDDGNSFFRLDRSGFFFFISGNPDHCKNNDQKLIVLVLAVRQKPQPPPAAPPSHPPEPAVPPSEPSVVTPPAPAPSPSKSLASRTLGGSVLVGVGVGVIVLFANFVGLV